MASWIVTTRASGCARSASHPRPTRRVVRPSAQVLVDVPGEVEQRVPDERLAARQAQFGGGPELEGDVAAGAGPHQHGTGAAAASGRAGCASGGAGTAPAYGRTKPAAIRMADTQTTGGCQVGAQPVQVVAGPAGDDRREFRGGEEQVRRVAGAQELQTAAQPYVEAAGADPVPDQLGRDQAGHGVREQIEHDLFAHEGAWWRSTCRGPARLSTWTSASAKSTHSATITPE